MDARANTFDVRPLSHREHLLLVELLDASSACHNEVNYDRRQAYFETSLDDPEEYTVSEFEEIVRNAASQEEYRQRYIQTLSSSTLQQLV